MKNKRLALSKKKKKYDVSRIFDEIHFSGRFKEFPTERLRTSTKVFTFCDKASGIIFSACRVLRHRDYYCRRLPGSCPIICYTVVLKQYADGRTIVINRPRTPRELLKFRVFKWKSIRKPATASAWDNVNGNREDPTVCDHTVKIRRCWILTRTRYRRSSARRQVQRFGVRTNPPRSLYIIRWNRSAYGTVRLSITTRRERRSNCFLLFFCFWQTRTSFDPMGFRFRKRNKYYK